MSWVLFASAVTGGAAAAAVGALAGGTIRQLQQDRRWLRDRQAASYTAVLETYAGMEQELHAAHLHAREPVVDWAPWDSAVASLTLVASQDVADAAAGLAQACVTVAQRVPNNSGPDDRWSPCADTLLAAQTAFVNAARRCLDRSQPSLRPYMGTHRLTAQNPAAHRDGRGTAPGSRRPAPVAGRPPVALNGNAVQTRS